VPVCGNCNWVMVLLIAPSKFNELSLSLLLLLLNA
jgi:hypothetical protein